MVKVIHYLMKSFPAAIFALAALALILSAAGCAELPQGAEGEGFFGPPDAAVQTTPTPAYLTEVTPMPTATPTAQPTFPKRPDSTVAANPYVEILNDTLVFNYNATAWTYDLVKAPMIIDLHVNPVLVKDVKAGDSSYGTKDEYTITKMVPSPLAEFEIRVINLSDVALMAQGNGAACPIP